MTFHTHVRHSTPHTKGNNETKGLTCDYSAIFNNRTYQKRTIRCEVIQRTAAPTANMVAMDSAALRRPITGQITRLNLGFGTWVILI